ncbi:MAG: pyridoxal 5'-phosphate synthase glutaminase subunit PdxT [Bacillota bacterium]|nr:pyridoxal 5'-phosphate synthase glutaminase subunit PdxT [Bacillota bacterium]
MRVGVLALQGDVAEHLSMTGAAGAEAVEVRYSSQIDGLDGLIIPGGESTTVGKLMERFGFLDEIRKHAARGLGVFGTCTGLILLAREVENSGQVRLGLMDFEVKRNAFGRQVDSFEADIEIPAIGGPPMRAVFIRAPYILSVGPGVEVLARFEDKIVLARQGRHLACAFHPEVTSDTRLHRYFLDTLAGRA